MPGTVSAKAPLRFVKELNYGEESFKQFARIGREDIPRLR